MKNLYYVIDQYQRGYDGVLNRLFYFRNDSLYFKNKELNQMFKNFFAYTLSEQKEAAFLNALQTIFSSISLSHYQNHYQIISYLEEKLF